MKTEDEENATNSISTCNPHIPNRKSPRCLPPPLPKPKPQEADSEEDKETNSDSEHEDKGLGKDNLIEEDKGRERNKEEEALDTPLGNPR